MKVTHAAKKPRWITRWSASLLGAALVFLGLGITPAQAASYDGMLNFGGFSVGAFDSSDGTKTYCLEPGALPPISEQLDPVEVTQLPAYKYEISDWLGWTGSVETSAASGETLRQMNWVLTEHGDGANQEQAVAVQIALWELRREAGNAAWLDGKLELISQNGGKSYVDSGIGLAQRARLEAKGPGTVSPSSGLTLAKTGVHGSGVVNYPAGTTGISIEGAVFSDGSTKAVLSGNEAGSLSWTADLHETGWNRLSEVTVSGTWAMHETYWPAAIVLHPPSRESEQRIGLGVAPVSGVHAGVFEPASLAVDSMFTPLISTQVPHGIVDRSADGITDENEAIFGDVVTVSSSAGSAPWPSRSGGTEYLPLHAEGTLYGPFAQPQLEQVTAPQKAPIAARTTMLLDRGPGSYPIDLAVVSAASGYYYWVWEINEQSQLSSVRESGLLESGSRFADRFGVREEGQLVPTELRWETQLKDQALLPGNRVLKDSVRVNVAGGLWLQDEDGERIPANMRFTVYQSDQRPVRQTEVPAGTREIGHMFLEVTAHDTWIDAPAFEISAEERGWVSVRACVFEADQDEKFRGLIGDWCDDYGVPGETAELLEPASDTLAQTGGIGVITPLTAGFGTVGIGVLLLGCAAAVRNRTQTRIQGRSE